MEEMLDSMELVRTSRAARIFGLVVLGLIVASFAPDSWKLAAANAVVKLTHPGCDDCRDKAEKPCVDCDDEALGLTLPVVHPDYVDDIG